MEKKSVVLSGADLSFDLLSPSAAISKAKKLDLGKDASRKGRAEKSGGAKRFHVLAIDWTGVPPGILLRGSKRA